MLLVAGAASLLFLLDDHEAEADVETCQDGPVHWAAAGQADPLTIDDGCRAGGEEGVHIRHMGEEYLADPVHAKRIVLEEAMVASNRQLQRVVEAAAGLGQHGEDWVYMPPEEYDGLASYLWDLELAGENYTLGALYEWEGRLYDIEYEVVDRDRGSSERRSLRIEYVDEEIEPGSVGPPRVNLTEAHLDVSPVLRDMLETGAGLDHGWYAEFYAQADVWERFSGHLYELQRQAGGASGSPLHYEGRDYQIHL